MTETTPQTEHLLLGDRARQALASASEQARQAHAEQLAAYRERAPKRAAEVAAYVLGADNVPESTVWTPTGGPSSGYSASELYIATGEIDGLRFETVGGYRSGEYGGHIRDLHLLVPCDNAAHKPADRRVEVHSLTHLGQLLDGDLQALSNCRECRWLRDPENPDNQQTTEAALVPAAPSLAEQLRDLVERIATDAAVQVCDERGVGA